MLTATSSVYSEFLKVEDEVQFNCPVLITYGEHDKTGYVKKYCSYVFQVLEGDGYPKSFGMIDTSDELERIAYLYFYDFDLDIIGEPDDNNRMSKFVESYFDYEF